jgi:ribosome-interacting GTPase 1
MISAPDKRPLLTVSPADAAASSRPFSPLQRNPAARTLKAKIAKLKSELINGPGGKSAGSKDAGRGFDVSKSGDTRIGLVGFPSVGKSTLLTQLTGTRSAVSEIEFTTLTWCVGA